MINKYWKINYSDDELENFIHFLKKQYSYIEKRRNKILKPSRISPKSEEILIFLHFEPTILNYLQRFSTGYLYDDKTVEITIEWTNYDTYQHSDLKIIDFDAKYVRKLKLEKLNEKN